MIELIERGDEAKGAYMDGYKAGLNVAIAVAEGMAVENERVANDLHKRANRQAKTYGEDVAEQTKIGAQVLDNCAVECRSVAFALKQRLPAASSGLGPSGDEQ